MPSLSFATEINGKPTNFEPKIWASFDSKHPHKDLEDKYCFLTDKNGCPLHDTPLYDRIGEYRPKLHTIRGATHSFKPGSNIVFKRWVGKPYALGSTNFTFAPNKKVTAIQDVVIRNEQYSQRSVTIIKDIGPVSYIQRWGQKINNQEGDDKWLLQFAYNDGFDSIKDFFAYFNKPYYKGSIIHWTNEIY